MKKVLSLLLIGVLSISLVGCVNFGEEEELGEVIVLDTLPTDSIEITFWHTYGTAKGALLDDMIADFMDLYPNITVTASSQTDYNTLRTTVGYAIPEKTTPTVVVGYPDHIAGYLTGNAVIPLDDFINHDTWGVDLEDFIDAYLVENTQYPDGKYYSFPYSKSTEMMVYNKTVIEANAAAITAALGEPFPTDRALTWAELDLLTPILVDPDWDSENPTAGKCQYVVNYDSPANFFINNVRMWDGGYTNMDGDILVNNTNTKNMLDYVSTRFTDHTFAIPLAWNESYGSANFIAGDACMSVGSTAGVSYNIPKAGEFEVGILPTPQYDDDHKSAVQQGPNIAVMSNSSDAERLAAWLLIKHLTNAENTAEWAMLTGYLPVRYSGYQSTAYQEFLNIDTMTDSRYYASLAAQAAYLQTTWFAFDPPFAGVVTSSDARNNAEIAMQAVFGGQYTTQEVIDDMLSQLGQ